MKSICICSLEEHTMFPGKCDRGHSPVRETLVKEFFGHPKGAGHIKRGPGIRSSKSQTLDPRNNLADFRKSKSDGLEPRKQGREIQTEAGLAT